MMKLAQGQKFAKLEAVYESKSSVYLVMELMQGGEILKGSSKKPTTSLKPEEIKIITKSLLEAVSELQAKNMIHRDIKPSNIML